MNSTKRTIFACVAISMMLLSFDAVASITRDFKQAKEEDTASAYSEFLQEHDSERNRKKKKRLLILEEAADLLEQAQKREHDDDSWRSAQEQDGIRAYEQYLSENHENKERIEASQQRILALKKEEKRAFEAAVKSAQVERLLEFISSYPDSEHASEATSLKGQLEEVLSNIASDPRLDSLMVGVPVSEVSKVLGKPKSSAIRMENFRVVGEAITWELNRGASRYYGVVRVSTDSNGSVLSINPAVAVAPSASEIAEKQRRREAAAARRRASQENTYVQIVNETDDQIQVAIDGERLTSPKSISIDAMSHSTSLELLPGDYRLTINKAEKSVVVPDRTYTRVNRRPFFRIFVQQGGALKWSSYPK